jgi:hypothetical protein
MSAATRPRGLQDVRETTSSYDEAEQALDRFQHQVDQNQQPKSAITVAHASCRASARCGRRVSI